MRADGALKERLFHYLRHHAIGGGSQALSSSSSLRRLPSHWRLCHSTYIGKPLAAGFLPALIGTWTLPY